MGAALFVELDSSDPGFDCFVNGKALARAEKKLAKAAKKLGVTPLMDFFAMGQEDLDAAAEDFGLPADAASPATHEPWFDAAKGLETVEALLRLHDEDPSSLGSDVREDLEELANVLRQARDRGLRWRLAIDY